MPRQIHMQYVHRAFLTFASVLATRDCRRASPGGDGWADDDADGVRSAACSASLGWLLAADDGDAAGAWRASSAACTISGWTGVGSSRVSCGQAVGMDTGLGGCCGMVPGDGVVAVVADVRSREELPAALSAVDVPRISDWTRRGSAVWPSSSSLMFVPDTSGSLLSEMLLRSACVLPGFTCRSLPAEDAMERVAVDPLLLRRSFDRAFARRVLIELMPASHQLRRLAFASGVGSAKTEPAHEKLLVVWAAEYRLARCSYRRCNGYPIVRCADGDARQCNNKYKGKESVALQRSVWGQASYINATKKRAGVVFTEHGSSRLGRASGALMRSSRF